MDNKNNQDNNGKMPKNGQTILILVIAAIITFSSITLMRNVMTKSSTEELPYSCLVYTSFIFCDGIKGGPA